MRTLHSHNRQMLTESTDICKNAVGFYEKLFKKEAKEESDIADCFYVGLAKVAADNKSELEAQISAAELATALQGMKSGIAPGLVFVSCYWVGCSTGY